jgi:hypothetical protein
MYILKPVRLRDVRSGAVIIPPVKSMADSARFMPSQV